MRLCLAVPAPFHAINGGAVYDRAIVDGLRALGHAVDIAELAGRHPLPDDAAHAAAAAAVQQAGDARLLIDGACLPAFGPQIEVLAARDAAALVHHPTALETGRDEASRTQLCSIERAMLPRLRRIVVTSTDTAQRLAREFGVAAEAVRVVEPGTPDAPRSEGPQQADRCLVLTIGSLLPRKGHDVLMRALARLPDLEWTLAIVGGARDAQYAEALHTLAETLGVASRVRFAGEVQPSDLEPFWRQAGVFALASHYEGYGMVIAEALRRGLPVAITTGSPLAAVLPAEAGVIAAPGDAPALSNALRRLIFDADLRRIMADGAWAFGRTLPDWQTQARRFAAAMEE